MTPTSFSRKLSIENVLLNITSRASGSLIYSVAPIVHCDSGRPQGSLPARDQGEGDQPLAPRCLVSGRERDNKDPIKLHHLFCSVVLLQATWCLPTVLWKLGGREGGRKEGQAILQG